MWYKVLDETDPLYLWVQYGASTTSVPLVDQCRIDRAITTCYFSWIFHCPSVPLTVIASR